MRAEAQAMATEIKEALTLLRRHLDWETIDKRFGELSRKAEDPSLWSDSANAQKVMRARNALERAIKGYKGLEQGLEDAVGLIELGESEKDEATVLEGEAELRRLQDDVKARQIEALLSGEADANDTYLEVHAGAGGTESQDWAQMLLRMYMRWAERRGYKVEVVDQSEGEQAGIKSATLAIKGENAFGWLKTESGVHRLVRISPFDANARRHTSFSSVSVYPMIDDSINIEVNETDVEVDLLRSSGAGGQHVNRTESAVRLKHIPTGIVVKCQEGRSQHKNRETAWRMLKAKLYERELKKREEKAAAEQASKTDIGWGHQIRSYVLQPYRLVKDLRTGVESSDPTGVLDGDIDGFVEAELARRVKGGAAAVPVADLD
ncbi:MAG: peptide chain release factor 2 [Hyphomicrobiaceae bacterium]|nr:MAG: peptide chain release factor 2 [Hyphomicrobiaceae bacterium]